MPKITLETFINLDHVLSIDFSQDNSNILECVIYYKEGEFDKLVGNEAMKFYTILMGKINSEKINFVVINEAPI